jgi:hypothetical protein
MHADARSAASAIGLVVDIDRPPRAVTVRALDLDGREVRAISGSQTLKTINEFQVSKGLSRRGLLFATLVIQAAGHPSKHRHCSSNVIIVTGDRGRVRSAVARAISPLARGHYNRGCPTPLSSTGAGPPRSEGRPFQSARHDPARRMPLASPTRMV